jgi:hypothetical protein
MAASVKEILGRLRQRVAERTEEAQRPAGEPEPRMRQEEEDPLVFFSDLRRLHRCESFVRLASQGAFGVIPDE